MAVLINCDVCGKKVSDEALNCLGCGHPVRLMSAYIEIQEKKRNELAKEQEEKSRNRRKEYFSSPQGLEEIEYNQYKIAHGLCWRCGRKPFFKNRKEIIYIYNDKTNDFDLKVEVLYCNSCYNIINAPEGTP